MRRSMIFFKMIAIAIITCLTVFTVHAAVFVYRWINVTVNVGNPTVWLEDPGTQGVTVRLYNLKTVAEINIEASPKLILESRNAVYYSNFSRNPINSDLVQQTCTWGYDSSTRSIYIAVSSRSASVWDYWCIININPSLLNILGYARSRRTVYVSFLVWRSSITGGRYINVTSIYLNSTTSPQTFYGIGFSNTLLSGRTGDNIYSLIYLYRSTSYPIRSNVYLGVSNIIEWGYLYHVSTAIDFNTWQAIHYVNTTYSRATTITSANRYLPFAVGIGYRVEWQYFWQPPSGQIYFDNLVVSIDYRPWYVNVTGIPDGWLVVLRDSTGYEIDRAVAVNNVASLLVVPKQPIDVENMYGSYTNSYLIIPNAKFEVYDSNNVLVASFDVPLVVGGDRYRFQGFSGYIVRIDSSYAQSFKAKLVLRSSSCNPQTFYNYIQLFLEDRNGFRSTPITIYRGTAVVGETSEITLTPINGVAGYIYALAYVGRGGNCVFDLELRYTYSNWATFGVLKITATFVGI